MKQARWITLLLLVSLLLAGLCACGGQQTQQTPSANSSEENSAPEGSEDLESNGNGGDTASETQIYNIESYYCAEPFISYQYSDLKAHEIKTGEKMGTLVLNGDGTALATYPGGSAELTWDDADIYLDGKGLNARIIGPMIKIDLPDERSITYINTSHREFYEYNLSWSEHLTPADSSVCSFGEPYTYRYYDGTYVQEVYFPVTNVSEETIYLDTVYYTVYSDSGEEIDYRSAIAYLTPILLPGETGFFFEHMSQDKFAEGSEVEPDEVFIDVWSGDYARYEVKDFTESTETYDHSFVHRPHGYVSVPAGTDPDTVKVSVICYDKDGKVIGIGSTENYPSDANPYNYMEIPAGGGDAPFMVNMDGQYGELTFDQSNIDHYEYIAYSPRYFAK